MSVATIWTRWKTRRALAGEFNALDTGQREELARDVCVSEQAFERLFLRGARTDELERLMGALALDLTAAELENPGAVTRDMSLVCADCAMIKRCRRELAAGSAREAYNEYCPNALTLNALLETQARSQLMARRRNRQA